MSWRIDLSGLKTTLESYPLTREEVGSKHQQFEKKISLDLYAKLLPIGEKLAPLVARIQNAVEFDSGQIEAVLTQWEMNRCYDAANQLTAALGEVSFDILRERQNPDGMIKSVVRKLDELTPEVDHWVRTLEQRVKDRLQQSKPQSPPPAIDTREAQEVIEELKKEKEGAIEAHAKLAQMELADDQINELTKCIVRHTTMSFRCLGALIAAAVIAARLVVWISADGDKLGIWWGPVFHAITPETSSGAAFYYGVGKLAVVSFAFGLVIAVGRLYQTYCHNLVINEQRMIAFRAFKKMLVSVPDPGPREKLVTAAANAIFEHGSSGFLPKGTNEFTPLIGPLMEAAKGSKKG